MRGSLKTANGAFIIVEKNPERHIRLKLGG